MSEDSLVKIIVAVIGASATCLAALICCKKDSKNSYKNKGKNIVNQSSFGNNNTQIGIQNNYGDKNESK